MNSINSVCNFSKKRSKQHFEKNKRKHCSCHCSATPSSFSSQAKEYVRLNQDIKTMREMLIHYEQIIDQKDQTEKNLSKALDLLYKKTTAYQHYYQWRLAFIEKRRQSYALSLAKRFYEDKLKRVMNCLTISRLTPLSWIDWLIDREP